MATMETVKSPPPVLTANTAAATNTNPANVRIAVLPRPMPMSTAQIPPTTAHSAHSTLRSDSLGNGSVLSTCHMNPMSAGPTRIANRWLPMENAPR